MRILIVSFFLLVGELMGQVLEVPFEEKPRLQRLWATTFQAQKQEIHNLGNKEAIDVLFVGDSLFHFWKSEGRLVWDLEFSQLRCANFAISGDRTQQILFRISRADLNRYALKSIILLAGTNNLVLETPENAPFEVFKGIQAIIERLQRDCPETEVILCTLPPNGVNAESQLNQRIRELNDLVRSNQNEVVRVLDLYRIFASASGGWKPEMTVDGTHFSQKGYERLAEAVLSLRKE